MSLFQKKIVTPFPKNLFLISEKVSTSEEVDQGNKNLDVMKESVVTIRRNVLDNFEGQSIVSTGWFTNDCEILK